MSKQVHSKRAVCATQTGLSGQIYLTQEVGKKSKLRKKLPQLDADLCSLFWLPCYRLPVNWVVLF